MLHLVVDAAARLEGLGLGRGGEIVQVGLEQPEGLHSGGKLVSGRIETGRGEAQRGSTDQQGRGDRLLAEVQEELFERHGLVVDADDEVA